MAKRIFHPFSQGDTSTTRQFGGTGLGLAISKRLARLLGGDVALMETQAGLGTRFRATVAVGPLDGIHMLEGGSNEQAVARLDRAPDAPAPCASDKQALNGVCILVAEDGPDNQRLIAHLLRRAGASVELADNGRIASDKALAAAQAQKSFDIILMDMQMPEMDGYEATAKLRRCGYRAPIVALTAHAMAADQQKCLDSGCDAYATKPIDRVKLLNTILRCLKGGAAEQCCCGSAIQE